MVVLYNGEYKEFDITSVPNGEYMLKEQNKKYPFWEGKVYGDFEILKIEYDWYLSVQRGHLRCVHCGEEKIINNPADFRRGKGASQHCKCQKPPSKKSQKNKKEPIAIPPNKGEIVNGFEAVLYQKNKGVRAKCTKCGKEKWCKISSFARISGNPRRFFGSDDTVF